jgi:predicted DNA-binding protein (UPF0251 family)
MGSLKERILRNYKENDHGCWIWQGALNRGYGRLKWKGRKEYAHRLSWIAFNGDIPKDKPDVLHTCDNPRCLNPVHLFCGTQIDNNADRDKKGRQAKAERNGRCTHPEKTARGENNGRTHLMKHEVHYIRCLHQKGFSQKEIIKKMGILGKKVTSTNVSNILSGKTWQKSPG